MDIQVGDRFASAAGNVFRVVALNLGESEPMATVERENNKGKWDEGRQYTWPAIAFHGMTRIPDLDSHD